MNFDDRIKEIEKDLVLNIVMNERRLHLHTNCEWLIAQLKAAVEVIQFYGHEPNWHYDPANARPELNTGWDEEGNTEATFDFGNKARAFLKGLEE